MMPRSGLVCRLPITSPRLRELALGQICRPLAGLPLLHSAFCAD